MSKLKDLLGRHKKLLILPAVLAALIVGYQMTAAGPARAAAAAAMTGEIPTFSLVRGSLRAGLRVSGNVTAADTASVTTSLPYPVAELLVQEGDTVMAGDLIARLDTAELDSQLRAAQQSVSNSQAQAQLAVDQAARRLEDARNQKKIDEENPDELPRSSWERVMRQDSLAIEDAQDALANAVLAQQGLTGGETASLVRQKEQCSITAPISGVVTRLTAQLGAAAGEIAVIEDTGRLEVTVNIKEYDINRIRLGQSAEITSGAGDRFAGEVAWIAPRASEGMSGETVYPVRLAIPDKTDALRLGMTARADIALEVRQNVFAVPLDAVGTDTAGSAVVWAKETAEDGSVTFAPIVVTTGLENDTEVEISAPELAEGMELRSMAPDELAPAGMEG